MQKVALANAAGEVTVIAGEYNGVSGSASTFTPIHLYNVRLNQGGKAEFNLPANFNTALLVIEGNVTINGSDEVPTDNFALFANEGEQFSIEASDDAVVLLMSGEPIKEPIAAHGPFVMNTNEELSQAFRDYNTGKFGYLED